MGENGSFETIVLSATRSRPTFPAYSCQNDIIFDHGLEMKSQNAHPREVRLASKHLAEVALTNARTAMVKLRAERDALVLAKARGDLIDRRRASWTLGFLITAAREAVRAWHVKLPPQLVGKDMHGIGQILREAEGELLNTLAALPEQLKNPISLDRIDDDLRPVEEKDAGNGDKAKDPANAQRQRYNERRRERRAKAKEA